MSGYNEFAYYYDKLTGNISYPQTAAYYDALIREHGGRVLQGGILLDLACGTGSLSEELCIIGYDVIGVDGSTDMLSVAMQKKAKSGSDIVYLCQDMRELDLYGTVDVTVCALDSINHLVNETDVQRAFNKVSLFTNPGGLFLFDVNTPYKHEHILGGNTFVYDCEDVYCVWQNAFRKSNLTVDISLDIFAKQDGCYHRYEECFTERAYTHEVLEAMLTAAGFELVCRYEGGTTNPPQDHSEKHLYVARKLG